MGVCKCCCYSAWACCWAGAGTVQFSLSLLCTSLFRLTAAGATLSPPLCYYVDPGHAWNNGLKATLNIQLDQDYQVTRLANNISCLNLP